MTQIGPRVAKTHAAGAIWVKRARILGIARLFDRNFSFRSEQQAVTRGPRGQDAIHHVDAQAGVLDDFLGRAHAHQVTRLVGGEMLQRGFDDLASEFARFADAQPSDGVAGKTDFDGALGGFFSELAIHAALDDAEEGLSLPGEGL